MKFSFTSLGCASALPTVNRFPSAHVLNVHERLFLIDCGEGCQMQLRKYGFSFLKIQNIFISHIHGDHIFGIFGLLSTMSLMGRSADLFIHAPKAFSGILANFIKHFGDMFKYQVIHKVLDSDQLTIIYEGKSMEILSFPLNHRIDCYGFLFREKRPMRNVYKERVEELSLTLHEIARLKAGEDIFREDGEFLLNSELTYSPFKPRSFAYCSDTAPYQKIYDFIQGVDVLYHEATFARDLKGIAQITMHSTAEDAANVALKVGARQLIMGHFSSRYRNLNVLLNEARELFEESYIAEEGVEFEIPLMVPDTK